MMAIPDKNETIYQVIYTSITEERKVKALKEFGFFNYFILPSSTEEAMTMGFSALDFPIILENGGKEFLENEFKEYECTPNCELNGKKFDLGIKVNLEKFKKAFEPKPKGLSEEAEEKFIEERKSIRAELDQFAKKTAEKLSNFRVKIYSYVFEKMLKNIKDKTKPKALKIHLNEKNLVHLVPLSDNLQLVYGVDFSQGTDRSLARVFLQELKEAKNHVKNCIAGNVYCELAETPKNIMDIDSPKNYSNGLVVFNLFVNKFDTIKKFLNYFVTFREYVQFHIHSIKTFLHIRMNRKGKELMGKLDGCRIIPESYIKHLESVQFYTNWNKKEENQKIFTDEVKKINV